VAARWSPSPPEVSGNRAHADHHQHGTDREDAAADLMFETLRPDCSGHAAGKILS
jgi:hypothetical protein